MILTITMNPALDKIYVIDDFKVDEIFRIDNMEINAAGKGVNVARVINKLGSPVKASGILGGNTGDYINNQLERTDIINEFVKIKENTRTCVKVIDNRNNTTTELLESGPEVSEKEIDEFLSKYENLIEKCEIITGCGSLAPGLPDKFYQNLIDLARSRNKKFLLDTSGKAFAEGIEKKPYMIKPNREEVENLLSSKYSRIRDFVDPLKYFRDKGITFPVITLGGKGCVVLIDTEIYYFKGLSLKTKNVVGSGDAFIAGCALALEQEKTPIEIIKMGMACGHANTQFYKTGMVSKALVNEYYDKINFKKIARI